MYAEVSPIVVSVLDGYNACIFAYGQVGLLDSLSTCVEKKLQAPLVQPARNSFSTSLGGIEHDRKRRVAP